MRPMKSMDFAKLGVRIPRAIPKRILNISNCGVPIIFVSFLLCFRKIFINMLFQILILLVDIVAQYMIRITLLILSI